MTRAEFIENLRDTYGVGKVLSQKSGAQVLRLRHRTLNKDIVLRSYPTAVPAYEKLRYISHPHLPEVLDLRVFSDGCIIIEEFVDGITVAEVLQSGLYTYNGAKSIVEGVASALCFLHGEGIVHRDIKPENIIIDKQGCVKLIDLNAARTPLQSKTADTVVLGTIGYAPPEQFGIAQSEKTADIYALGVLLNVMLTGRHPSEKLASGKAGRIVLRCTQINPAHRFSSVEKLIEAL